MRVHFISIGGSIMHNLAISMYKKGHQVSGSDDEIFDPAKSRLEKHGLLPSVTGWDESRIDKDIDIVVLGMHAKSDNPELVRAQELKLRILSFPELIYENSRDKKRVAIAGSHGKTTITSMVMHALSESGNQMDYMVGAKIPGFEDSVRLSEDSQMIILEADEYLSSAIDMRPKFLWYRPQLALISGIAWDHMNVFPSFELYKEQFLLFLKSMPEGAELIYYSGDQVLSELVEQVDHLRKIPYDLPGYEREGNRFVVDFKGREVKLELNGSHNLLNLEGARLVCEKLGLSPEVFYSAIQNFKGAGKRLEKMYETDELLVFKDFAHAPSKVEATIRGIKDQYPERQVIACLELHTYSSLNKEFLPQYARTADHADRFFVFINEEAVRLKRMEMISEEEVKGAFMREEMEVFYELPALKSRLSSQDFKDTVVLLMSSGNFAGWDMDIRAFL